MFGAQAIDTLLVCPGLAIGHGHLVIAQQKTDLHPFPALLDPGVG